MIEETSQTPDRRHDVRIAAGLFLLFAVSYGYFFGGGGWNQNAQFDLTRAMVERREFAIDAFKTNTGDISFHAGHVYANKSPGTSFLAVVPYALIYLVERACGIDPNAPMIMTLNLYLLTLMVCGLLGALIPPLLYLYGLWSGLATPLGSLGVALVVGFATPLFPYTSVLFSHVPAASLMFAAFVLASLNRGRWDAAAGLLAGLAAMTNYLAVPVVVLLAGLIAWKRKNRGQSVARFLAGAVPPVLLLAVYQQASFGSFLTTPIDTMAQSFVDQKAWMGIIRAPSLEAAWGISLSRYRGLFYLSPVLILAFAGAIALVRRRQRIPELFFVFLVSGGFFLFNITFNGWHGGSAAGPRYLVPLIPLLGMLMMPATRSFRFLWVALTLVSFVSNFAVTTVNPMPSQRIHDPLGSYVYPLLLTGQLPADTPAYPPLNWKKMLGHVSVNRLSADQFVPFMKHPPGSAVSEWASFNLGEVLLPGDPRSVIPVLVWIFAGSATLFLRVRPRPDDRRT